MYKHGRGDPPHTIYTTEPLICLGRPPRGFGNYLTSRTLRKGRVETG